MAAARLLTAGLAAAGSLVAASVAIAQTSLPPLSVEASKAKKQAAAKKAPAKAAAAPKAEPETAPKTQGAKAPTRDTYLPSNALTATKTDTPLLETPQGVSVVTRKQLDDQNQQSVAGALGYTAGVLTNLEQNPRYDNVFLRGFGGFSTNGNYVRTLDGLRLPQGPAFGIMSIDPFLLERIDVIKGPSALLYGQVNPGGLVNMVSRAPSAEPYNELRLEAGSYGRTQAAYTTQGSFDKEGKVQYSLTAVGRQSGTRYDDVDEERYAIAPAIAWQISPDTRLTLSGFYQADPEGGYSNSAYPRALAAANGWPYLNSRFNPGDPSYEHFDREEGGIGYQLEHRFNGAVLFRSTLRYAAFDIDFAGLQITGGPSATGDIERQATWVRADGHNIAADNQLQLDFSTGALQHRVLTGIDTQWADSNTLHLGSYNTGTCGPEVTCINVTNPQYGSPVSSYNLTFATSGEQSLDQTGVYVQDQMAFGNWRALLGVRHDWTEAVTTSLDGVKKTQDPQATTYRAGLLYLFENGLAPYASYSTSFEPVVSTDKDGNPFVPTEAEQYEIGIKYQPRFMPALFTVSAFDITQENVLATDPTNARFSVQLGEVRSRGLEFEARGKLTSQLDVIGALTLLDTEITKSSSAMDYAIGKRPIGVPDYFWSVWGNYRFDTGLFKGLTLGGGVRVVGESEAYDASTTVEIPSYTLVDAAVSYDLGTLDPKLAGAALTLNVWNLEDKEYYSTCRATYLCPYGDRRTFLAGLRYRW